jgi:hypothetical protein
MIDLPEGAAELLEAAGLRAEPYQDGDRGEAWSVVDVHTGAIWGLAPTAQGAAVEALRVLRRRYAAGVRQLQRRPLTEVVERSNYWLAPDGEL